MRIRLVIGVVFVLGIGGAGALLVRGGGRPVSVPAAARVSPAPRAAVANRPPAPEPPGLPRSPASARPGAVTGPGEYAAHAAQVPSPVLGPAQRAALERSLAWRKPRLAAWNHDAAVETLRAALASLPDRAPGDVQALARLYRQEFEVDILLAECALRREDSKSCRRLRQERVQLEEAGVGIVGMPLGSLARRVNLPWLESPSE